MNDDTTENPVRGLLVGRTFRVEDIAGLGTLDRGHPELVFDVDGAIHGHATVNRIRGTYEVTGSTLTVRGLASTRMAGDEGAMAQEDRLLAFLDQPLTVRAGEPGTGWVLLDDGAAQTRLVDMTGESLRKSGDAGTTLTVSGTVVYPQRMALVPEAVTTVTLEDTALADARSTQLAVQHIVGGQVPIPFELTVQADAIEETAQLAVRARITVDDQLNWTSDTAHLVARDQSTHGVIITVVQVTNDAS